MTTLTQNQVSSLQRLYERSQDGCANLQEFILRARHMFGTEGAVVIEWCRMFVGIEPDGHTHCEP